MFLREKSRFEAKNRTRVVPNKITPLEKGSLFHKSVSLPTSYFPLEDQLINIVLALGNVRFKHKKMKKRMSKVIFGVNVSSPIFFRHKELVVQVY